MPLYHYLPATFLAGFSYENSYPRRERTLAIGDKKTGRVFTTSAANVAGINDLYTITSSQPDPQLVDRSLSGYEQSLEPAIDQLINRSTSAMTWAGTLVPFIAALFVRGPDFNSRFEARMAALGVDAPPDNTNFARLIEYQRLLAPVAAARWLILQARGGQPLITNDLGYAPFVNFQTHDRGVAVPITREQILALVPTTTRKLAVASGGQWLPTLEYVELPPNNHVSLNDSVASFSQRFIFGPDEKTVRRHLTLREAPPVPEPGQLGFIDGHLAMLQEMTWHRLITALSVPPENDDKYIYVDFLKQGE